MVVTGSQTPDLLIKRHYCYLFATRTFENPENTTLRLHFNSSFFSVDRPQTFIKPKITQLNLIVLV